ncbi:PAAR domain-containing protein [Salinicola sp. CPA57]|uniref:PAAR domain-containing protein n=1 Tax=Salinicola sp. CPA57 TaxID=1949080 RepID=UPI000DA15F55|nr:PAAR domain-containing protein [Salinicola sp. CPA57]
MFNPGDGMIRLGDASSHGGKVITGQSNYIVHGKPVAVVGDKVTCPKDGHGSVCNIVEGHPTLRINGKQVAFQGCHTSCGAALVSSMGGTHMIGSEEAKSPPVPKPVFSPAAAAAGRVMSDETAEKESQPKVAPGFHVVRKAGYLDQIKSDLLPSPSPNVDAMFERLNTHLPDYVLPGSLIVLSDPENQMCMAEEKTLQDQARLAQQTVQKLKPEQARVMMDNWGAMIELENAANGSQDRASAAGANDELAQDISDASTRIGVTTATLDPLKSATAEALDQLARQWEAGTAKVSSYLDGKMSQMNNAAHHFMDRSFQLAEEARDLKVKIGVAAEHPLHSVRQAIEGMPEFRVPTVGDGIRLAGRWAKTLDVTNYLAIALDYTATDLAVENACNDAVDIQTCRQVQFEEYGGFVGRTGGGAMGTAMGTTTGARICMLGVGLSPGGKLVCAALFSGTGGYAGMKAGDAPGRRLGSTIYEVVYGNDEE